MISNSKCAVFFGSCSQNLGHHLAPFHSLFDRFPISLSISSRSRDFSIQFNFIQQLNITWQLFYKLIIILFLTRWLIWYFFHQTNISLNRLCTIYSLLSNSSFSCQFTFVFLSNFLSPILYCPFILVGFKYSDIFWSAQCI